MYKKLILLSVLLLGTVSTLYADDATDKKIADLSTRIQELNTELAKLNASLQEVMQSKETGSDTEDVQTADAAEDKDTVSDKKIDALMADMKSIMDKQNKLSSELEDVQQSSESTVVLDENGNIVRLGVVDDDADSDAEVLEYYGNANDVVDSDTVYVDDEPEYILVPQKKPKVGISFFFGTRPYYRDPWPVNPPWWRHRPYRRPPPPRW